MRIGVLALQGDFAAHRRMMEKLGRACLEVRQPVQLDGLDGLILPGGESTTMLKFLTGEGFLDPLHEFESRGGAFFGTCAGAILLAKEVTNPGQPSLGVLDVSVRRNGYGRQKESFVANVPVEAFANEPFEMVFIRAPIVERLGAGVRVLAEKNGQPVLVEQGRHLAATFHPELTTDDRIHRRFLETLAKFAAGEP